MHPDRPHYDAVIVGARVGRRALVVDRSRYGSGTLSTYAQRGPGR